MSMYSDGQSCAHERCGSDGQGAPHCVRQWSKGIATATATATAAVTATAAAAAAMENHLLSHVTRTHATDPTTLCPVTRPYETNGRAAPSAPGGPRAYISTPRRRVAGEGGRRVFVSKLSVTGSLCRREQAAERASGVGRTRHRVGVHGNRECSGRAKSADCGLARASAG